MSNRPSPDAISTAISRLRYNGIVLVPDSHCQTVAAWLEHLERKRTNLEQKRTKTTLKTPQPDEDPSPSP